MPLHKKLVISDRPTEEDSDVIDGQINGGMYNNNYEEETKESDGAKPLTHGSFNPNRRCDSCPSFSVFFAIFYIIVCLTYSLTMRLYLKAYYCSSFVAGWSVIFALFIIFHHVCKLRNLLGCEEKCFYTYQTAINGIYLMLTVCMGVGYTTLTVISIHTNYDYAVAAALAFVNGIIQVYLVIISIAASRANRYSMYYINDNSLVWTTHSDTQDLSSYEMNELPNNKRTSHKNSRKCLGCCRSLCRGVVRCVVSLVYYMRIIVMTIVMVLSTCYPFFVLTDTLLYRENGHMYTVEVEGHYPLSLFMKCRGNGNTTLVYENGLGGLAYMEWDFIPRFLEDNYTVCVHDRRGYGWSEGFEHDKFHLLWKEPQWSKINAAFFIKLVEKANISTPFYYMGHSYGGSHLIYTQRQRPDIIKGLIFLDSVEFDAIENLSKYLGLLVNLQPSGFLYLLTKTGLVDYKESFRSIGDFESLTAKTGDLMISALRSGTYLEYYLKEWGPLRSDTSEYSTHPHILSGMTINVPSLVIDKDGRNEKWFPGGRFPLYNQSFYNQVENSTHTSLVYSETLTPITASLIDYFVQYWEDHIGFNEYLVKRSELLTGNYIESPEDEAGSPSDVTTNNVTTTGMNNKTMKN